MHQVQLVDYAQHSQKITHSVLSLNDQKKKVPAWRILFAHFVDFGFIFFGATFMATLFNEYFKTVLVTSSLHSFFSAHQTINLMTTLLPVFVFGAFFFSYFFNHGQSYGMVLMKIRVQMKYKSFKDALFYALQSTGICFTGGLTTLVFPHIWSTFRSHDYLYEDLMAFKASSEINLVKRADDFVDKKWDEIIVKEAA